MHFAHLIQIPFSSSTGWDELRSRQPSIVSLVMFIVLPMSLIPPVMLYYAGTHYGDAFIPGFGDKSWQFITTIFFLSELLSFAVMGWLIHEVAGTHHPEISLHDTYLLAALAPIPLWLSALGLLIPNLVVNMFIALAALAASCLLVYHGLQGLKLIREDVEAMSVTYTIMAASVIAWAILLSIVWAF